MTFTNLQIQGATENALLHGFQEPSQEQCLEWLQWYFDHKTPITSIAEAKRLGLAGLITNGIPQQRAECARIFGGDHA